MSQSDRDTRIQAQILAALQSAPNGLTFAEMSWAGVAGKATSNGTLDRNLEKLVAGGGVRVHRTRRTTTGPLLDTYFAQEVTAHGSPQTSSQ